jgi:hypothetical protein
MPKTKEIEIGYGITANLGNYQSERIDLSMRVTLEPDDDEDQVVNDYLDYLKGKCQEVQSVVLTKAQT